MRRFFGLLLLGTALLPRTASAQPSLDAPVTTGTTGLAGRPDAPPTSTAAPAAGAPTVATPADAAAPAGGLPDTSEDSFNSGEASANMLVSEEGPKLELYGFADFSYLHLLGKKGNIQQQYVGAHPSFYVGHLNLYLASTLGENWRSLAEVRFTYSPLGSESKPTADGTFPAPDTSTNDYAELQRSFSWGDIEIQRAWIEYQPFDFLSIRGGEWLTPYGYWNDDHGSPTIIAVHKPFPISDTFFPEHQTGLIMLGKVFVGSSAIGYAATLSNGRGPYDVIRDLDNNKAVGGRLYVESSALGNLTVGVAAYRGRYTASTKRYRVDNTGAQPVAVIYRTIDSAYEELSLSADVRFLWKGLHVQGEVMTNEAHYDPRYRPRTAGFDPAPTFAADYRRVGGYLLLGYRTPWHNLMPYVMGEYSSYTNLDVAPPVWAWSAGLNLRATPNVVVKAELAISHFVGTGSTGLGKDDLPYFGSQIAWAF